jgi:hypothetical protein
MTTIKDDRIWVTNDVEMEYASIHKISTQWGKIPILGWMYLEAARMREAGRPAKVAIAIQDEHNRPHYGQRVCRIVARLIRGDLDYFERLSPRRFDVIVANQKDST